MKKICFSLMISVYCILSTCFTSCNFQNECPKQIGNNKESKSFTKEIFNTHSVCSSIDSAILYPEEVEYLVIHGGSQFRKLPIEIKKMKNIVYISIQDQNHLNWRDTFRKLSSLKSLQTLGIIDCDVSRLPNNLSRLNGIKKLRIQNCNENKTIVFPLAITKLTSLEELFITCTKNKSLPKQIKSLTKLKSIGIGESFDEFPNELLLLNNIEEIYLDYNNINELPNEIVNLGKLGILSIKNTPLVQEEIEYIYKHNGEYNKLKYLKEKMPKLDIQLFYSGPAI